MSFFPGGAANCVYLGSSSYRVDFLYLMGDYVGKILKFGSNVDIIMKID